MINIRFAKKIWIPLVGIVIFAVFLLVTGKRPLEAQARSNRIPDLTGVWVINMPNVCYFSDVLAEKPYPVDEPYCGTPDDTSTKIVITRQSGRLFAGSHYGSTSRDKLTGYLAPDGTVSIQFFIPDNQHFFVTANVAIERGAYVMRGYMHGFQELVPPLGSSLPTSYQPAMYTFEVVIVRQ